ncbi:hypothetical protein DPEC_G00182900 [Dallia pectoralis]|uniref:Uncharacterized protein n=1 Tax=Dallia pectoralis TaxID=75939 RepID=A0ACC2GB33_DALPE|nr:hypothetical protein DPEC_G00182900 [Dallia pectoralis]
MCSCPTISWPGWLWASRGKPHPNPLKTPRESTQHLSPFGVLSCKCSSRVASATSAAGAPVDRRRTLQTAGRLLGLCTAEGGGVKDGETAGWRDEATALLAHGEV